MFRRSPLIILFLVLLTSCSDAPSDVSQAKQQNILLSAAKPAAQAAPKNELSADSPSLIQVKNEDGSNIYYLFGSNGAWATSSDLHSWTELTAQGDINRNGVTNEPNDQVLGFSPFQATTEHAPTNPYDFSGYYFQLSREKGRGILWANDANGDGVVDTAPIQENSATKESETIGFWSPNVVKLADGKYYFYYSHCNLPGTPYCGDSHAYMGVAKSKSIEGPYKNISVFMQSHGQVGDGASDLVPGYDGQGWQPKDHPAALSPDVFLDKDGQPWLVYGSRAGGIWIKQLNAKTGLPLDFGDERRSYGTRIAGGQLSVIDTPSIWYSAEADYYYLLLTYTGSNNRDQTGLNIRVARAKHPDGPYLDPMGNDLSQMHVRKEITDGTFIVDETETASYGLKLIGSHLWRTELGDSTKQSGYWSPGNGSVFKDNGTGKTFLLFDAANSAGATHQVRIHEVNLTENGWPVVAARPYSLTTIEKEIRNEDVVGDYQLVYHASDNNVTPHTSVFINLGNDGAITGDLIGSFHLDENRMILEIDGLGIFTAITTWQMNDRLSQPQLVPTFSAVATDGLSSLWATQEPKRSPQEKLDSIHNAMASQLPDYLAQLPELPSHAAYGASITWHSTNPQLINLTSGVITRPFAREGDVETILQATITLPDKTQKTVDYPVTIPAQTPNNLIAHYGFEGNLEESTTGRNKSVITGQHLHLPGQGNAKFAKGQQGKALLLNGTYGVDLGVGLLPYESFTLSYWMKPTVVEPNQPSLFISPSKGDGYDRGTFFGIYNQVNDWADTVTVWNRNGSDDDWPFLASSHAAQLHIWQHVAVSCQQGNCILYINGQPSGNSTLGIVSGENVTLAIGVNLWDNGFVGLIDELKVYDEALSAAEINALDYTGTPKSHWLSIATQDLKKNLEAQNIDMLKADLFLPHQGSFQSTVTWSSSDPDIISSNGKVARPEQGKPPKNVTLSATVSLDGEQQTLGIPVNVMSESMPKPLVSYSFENNLYDNQWNHSSDKLTGRHLMAKADENIVALYQPGIKGKALYLDGTYGAILAEHLIMDDDYTISVWLKPAAFSLHTSALFWYVNWDQWLSVVPYDVNESLNIWTLKQGVYTDHSYVNSLQASKWVHVTASVKGNKTRLYLNGEHVTSFDTIPNLFVGHPTNLAVGINFWDKPFQGLVDELVIFHEAIGDGEARKIYGQYERN